MPNRSRYRWGALTIATTLPLPELRRASSTGSDWAVGMSVRKPPPRRWYHHWRHPQDPEWLSFGRVGQTYVLRFERTATFRVDPVRRRIAIERGSGLAADALRRLLLNQVLPLVAGLSHLVLHASAVRWTSGAIALAGDTGAGKSTLAAALCGQGVGLVSDDALILRRDRGRWLATPSYPGLRLWGASARAVFPAIDAVRSTVAGSRKYRMAARGVVPFSSTRVPLQAICLLDRRRHASDSLTRMPAREALVALLRLSYQIDIRDRARVAGVTEQLARLVEALPVYRLRYARGLNRIDEVTGLLRQAFRPPASADVA